MKKFPYLYLLLIGKHGLNISDMLLTDSILLTDTLLTDDLSYCYDTRPS